MAGAIEVEVRGLERLLRTLRPELVGAPMRHFFQRATTLIANEAKRRAPVGISGHLRSKISSEVDKSSVPLFGKVGTRVHYAPYQEYGTGSEGDPEVPHVARHWPPGHALGLWASRHGFRSGAQVARIIGKRGGLRPRRFFRGAVKETEPRIPGLLEQAEREIKAEWDRR